MRKNVDETALAEPFCVYASNAPDFEVNPDAEPFNQTFATRQEANRALARVHHRYKWIAEIGQYKEMVTGELVLDWIWYWWSPNDKYGEPSKLPNNGLPENDITTFYSYSPLVLER